MQLHSHKCSVQSAKHLLQFSKIQIFTRRHRRSLNVWNSLCFNADSMTICCKICTIGWRPISNKTYGMRTRTSKHIYPVSIGGACLVNWTISMKRPVVFFLFRPMRCLHITMLPSMGLAVYVCCWDFCAIDVKHFEWMNCVLHSYAIVAVVVNGTTNGCLFVACSKCEQTWLTYCFQCKSITLVHQRHVCKKRKKKESKELN